MTIEEMREHDWSISWSGGKDSTATVILCHEYGIPIKEIIYVRMMYDDELPATLPIMTDFVDNAIKVFESWGYKVRVVKSIKTAKQLIEARYKRSKYEYKNGNPYGVTAFYRGFCKFTGTKQNTIKSINSCDYEMIGYAADEVDRLHRLTEKKCSIMAEFGIKEKDTFDLCRKYNLLSPLYDLGIKRDGCWFCPNAANLEIQYIKEHYPELVKKIYEMIEMCEYSIKGLEKRNNWVAEYLKGEKHMRIYNVHYGMNGEEHDYVIEAMSESDALTSCWRENGEGKYGSGTYIVLWTEYLPDCDENRKLCRRIEG